MPFPLTDSNADCSAPFRALAFMGAGKAGMLASTVPWLAAFLAWAFVSRLTLAFAGFWGSRG